MAEIILPGDALEQLRYLPPESVHTCVTSPPYYNLRDYGAAGQIGNEASVEEYLQSLVSVFREVRRVLRADGTLWVNAENLPAADVSPVVHGRWNNMDGYKTRKVCSECSWDVPEYGKFYSYCPNCGAKMDGGANNG